MRRSHGRLLGVLRVTSVVLLVLVFLFGMGVAYTLGFGYDSHAYWTAAHDLAHLYDRPPLARDAYLYSPAFVTALWPLAQLPWPVFAVCWGALLAGCFFWLLRRLPPFWFVPAALACVPEVLTGNVYALMAVAMVIGLGHGAAWSFPLLTKVTPGLVGLGFLVVRGDWRRLAYGLGATALAVAFSALVVPGAWTEWVHFLVEQRSSGAIAAILPVPVRVVAVAVAVVLVLLAARRDRYWLLPVAGILVSPTLGPNTLTLLAAVPRLLDIARERPNEDSAPRSLAERSSVRPREIEPG
jgi:Glycosyltransferase family 87